MPCRYGESRLRCEWSYGVDVDTIEILAPVDRSAPLLSRERTRSLFAFALFGTPFYQILPAHQLAQGMGRGLTIDLLLSGVPCYELCGN